MEYPAEYDYDPQFGLNVNENLNSQSNTKGETSGGNFDELTEGDRAFLAQYTDIPNYE